VELVTLTAPLLRTGLTIWCSGETPRPTGYGDRGCCHCQLHTGMHSQVTR